MMRSTFLVFAASAACPTSVESQGYKSSQDWKEFVVTMPTGEELVDASALPRAWDWRNVNGKNFATANVNQHIPQYCGSCWIHGTVAALNDRIKIRRGAAFPDVMLSRQVVLDCVPGPNNTAPPGCNGGEPPMIHDYLTKSTIPDETCKVYVAKQMSCEQKCMNCYTPLVAKAKGLTDPCFTVPHWTGYGVIDHGKVKGEVAMMKEIYARGPIACQAATDRPFMLNLTENALAHEGVYVTDLKYNKSQIDHVMSVSGWGETATGRKYWVIRNSWGTYWGQEGWFLLERGTNPFLIESEPCYWATVSVGNLNLELEGRVWGDYVSGAQPVPSSVAMTTRASPVGVWVCFSVGIAAALGAAGMALLVTSRYARVVRQETLLG